MDQAHVQDTVLKCINRSCITMDMCDQRFCPFIFWITFELLFIQLIMPQNVICEVLRVNSGGFLCRVYSIMGRHNPVMVVAVFYHAKVRKK